MTATRPDGPASAGEHSAIADRLLGDGRGAVAVVALLEAAGIPDRNLWRLRALVAAEIAALP